MLPRAKAVVKPSDRRPDVEALYRWAGVPDEPRPEHVCLRAEYLSAAAVKPATVEAVRNVLRFLIQQWSMHRERVPLARLRELAWLPAEGHLHWHRPSDLFATYRRYIFATQALFLDLPAKDQNQDHASDLLDALGIRREPSVGQVIEHLRHCVAHGQEVHKDVYQFLDNNAGDPRLPELAQEPCLMGPGGEFRQARPGVLARAPLWSVPTSP